jgi:hypothetical protein
MPDKSQFQFVEKYIHDAAVRLHLSDWDISLSEEPADEDDHAYVDFPNGSKRAVIHLGNLFWRSSACQRRHTIVHELLHLHLAPLEGQLQGAKRLLGEAVYTAYSESVNNSLEYAVDGIADAIAVSFPEIIVEDTQEIHVAKNDRRRRKVHHRRKAG